MKKKRKSKNIYDKYITLENLYEMWSIIKKTCKNRKEVYYFSLNLNTNLYNIYLSLKNKTYKPSKYKTFMIFEPKPRLVMSQTISDKLVNHFVANFYLMKYLEPCLIDTNIATRKDKGSSYGMALLKKYFNKILINHPNEEIYCLKIDISKYFYSIDHEILLKMLQEKIADQDVIDLIKTIISETNNKYVNDVISIYNKKYNTDIPYYTENTGLSIGAMSSQFLAIFYLNNIDHYIKEELHCKYFIRYMDDFLILDTDKEKLKYYYKEIINKIQELNLKINKKSNIYRSSKGFSFLGYTYKVIHNKLHISCKKDTYIRIQKKLKYLKKNDITKYKKSLGSYYGYFEIGSKLEREKIKMSTKDLYNLYKKEYENHIVIIKDRKNYKVYGEDSKIIWYLFNYKYNGNVIYFNNNQYDKVINKLKDLNINFLITTKAEILLTYSNTSSNYKSYYQLSNEYYNNLKKENYLLSKFKLIIKNNPTCYYQIYDALNELEKNLKE